MRDLNRWTGIGRLGKDPVIAYMPSGEAVAKFSMACSDDYKDKQGNKVDKTEWIPVVAFGRNAEVIGEYVRKGSKLYVEGKFTTRKYTDKQSNQDRFVTEIRLESMQMLDGKQQNSAPNDGWEQAARQPAQQQSRPAQQQPLSGGGGGGDYDDDIPFAKRHFLEG